MTVAALLFAKTFPIVITDHLICREGASGTPMDTALTGLDTITALPDCHPDK